MANWPGELKAKLMEQARSQVMWEMAHKAIVTKLVEHFASTGISCLFMKGTANAYSIYDDPALRPRGDSDVLIREADLEEARDVLEVLGYEREMALDRRFRSTTFQETWIFEFNEGNTHCIDLHWQVFGAQVFADILPAERSFKNAEPLLKLSSHAKTMSGVHRLIHGCINRRSHESIGVYVGNTQIFSGDRLCWAMDFHLLARSFSTTHWKEFVDEVVSTNIAPVCLDGLNFARKMLNTPVPDNVLQALSAQPEKCRVSNYYDSTGGLSRALLDLQSTPGLAAKVRFAIARIFPSRAFMTSQYPNLSHQPTAILYARRVIKGVASQIKALKRLTKRQGD